MKHYPNIFYLSIYTDKDVKTTPMEGYLDNIQFFSIQL